MNKIFKKNLQISLEKPVLTVLSYTFITLFLSMGSFFVIIDDDFVKMFPDNIESKKIWDDIQNDFGSTEYLTIAFSKDGILSDQVAHENLINYVAKLKKIRSENNEILIDRVFSITNSDFLSQSNENIKLKDYDSNLLEKFTHKINEDSIFVSIYIAPKKNINNSDLVKEVKDLTSKNLSDYDVHYAGQPYLTGEIPELISQDIRKLMLIGIFIMLLILGVNFKSVYAVCSIILTTLFSLFGMLGSMGWLYFLTGYNIFNFTILSTSLPIILLTIANSDGVHIVSRFFKQIKKGKDVKLALNTAIKNLSIPIFLTSLTTAIAFLSMIFSPIPHMVGYGIIIAIGVLWAWILSTRFLPSILILKKWNLKSKVFNSPSIIEKFIHYLSLLISKKPKKILIVSLLIVCFAFIGIFFIKIEVNVVKFFKEDTSIRKSTNFIDDNMSGSMSLAIKADGDFNELKNIQYLESLESYIMDSFEDVKTSMSYPKILKEINRSSAVYFKADNINDYYAIPSNKEDLEFVLNFPFEFGGLDKNLFEDNIKYLIDISKDNYKKKTLLLHQIKTISTEKASDIANQINKKIIDLESSSEIDFHITGLLVFLKEFVSMVVQSALLSIFVSVIAIALVIGIFFKKYYWAIVSVIPLISAVILNFGLMGLLGIELSHLTALLTAIVIGVGVDFSIHYIYDYQRKINIGFNKNINLTTIQDVGYPIVLDVASNLGFIALIFSSIIPISYIGGLMVFAMLSTSFGALLFLSSITQLSEKKLV